MQRLATPQLTLKIIGNRAACDAYITAAGLDKHIAADLRQLLGFNELPKDGRKQKRLTAMYQLVDKMIWLYHPQVSVAVPLIGGTNEKRFASLKKDYDITFGFATFEKLVAGTRKAGGWYKGVTPSAVNSLPDGASLFGLAADPPAPAPATSQPEQYGVPNFAAALGFVGAQTHTELPPLSFQAAPAGGNSLPDGASLFGLAADPPAPAPATSQPEQYGLRRGCRLPLPCFRVSLLLHLSHLSPDPGVLVCHAQLDFVAEPALFRQLLLFHICFKLRDLGMHFALRVLVNRRHELTVHSDVVVSQLTILA